VRVPLAWQSRRGLSSLLPLFLFLLLFPLTACSLIDPGVTATPASGSAEINPKAGIKLQLTGLGTRLVRLEVSANGDHVKAKIDKNSYLEINGRRQLDTDTVYEVYMVETNRQNTRVISKLIFSTPQTPQPEIPSSGLVASLDNGAEIKWNVPIKDFTYAIEPAIAVNVKTDNAEKVSHIEIVDFKQGQTYYLKILDAVGLNGYRMKKQNQGFMTTLSTTKPLNPVVEPASGSEEVNRSAGINMTFGDDIANPAVAPGLFSIEPATAGTFSWSAPNKLLFTPTAPWDFETAVSAKLTGGVNGLRGKSGSYMDGDAATTFVTGVFKRIDVNLSEQRLTLFEGGAPVFTCLVSSGKSGYSTPTGDFRIYSKNYVAAMGSGEGAAEPYMIPDVPYVMWFNSNYSIHGAYWHNDFGNVRSHGCVNISVSNAEFVFGWASVGTPVSVHY
jgi:hypothetical protein